MGVSTMGPPGCLIMCFNMITALSSAVWTPAQPKNNVWEGPAGICRTHKQGLQGLEEQPKRTPRPPPRPPLPAGQHSVPASPRDVVTKFVKDRISMPGSFSLCFSLC